MESKFYFSRRTTYFIKFAVSTLIYLNSSKKEEFSKFLNVFCGCFYRFNKNKQIFVKIVFILNCTVFIKKMKKCKSYFRSFRKNCCLYYRTCSLALSVTAWPCCLETSIL